MSPGLLKAPCVNPSRASLKAACADLRSSPVCRLMDETLTDILCQGEGPRGVMGPCRGRLSRPGGTARRWHAGHSEGASMFSPYMMLHVLFFLGLLWGVKWTELCLLSGSPSVAVYNGHFRQGLAICQYY